MLYTTQEAVRAEIDHRRDRITRDYQEAARWSLRRKGRDRARLAVARDWRSYAAHTAHTA